MMLRRGSALVGGLASVTFAVGLVPAAALPASAVTVCQSGVPGDVNGDGYAEVAVRSRNPESVHVFFGHPTGLQVNARGSAHDDQVFTQNTPGVPGKSGAHGFGKASAFGDFNGDGCADLAVGADGESSVTVIYGSPSGLSGTGAKRVTTADTPLADDPNGSYGGEFGSTLAAGDLDGDGVDDLAVGAPNAVDCGSDFGCGAVVVLHGGRGGLRLTSADVIRGDDDVLLLRFGTDVTVGDFDGDGRPELAASAPWDNEIRVYAVGPSGVQRDRTRVLGTDLPGLPAAVHFGAFGQHLTAGDTDGDAKDELVATIGEEDGGEHSVVVLPGTADGPTGVGSQPWTAKDLGLTDTGDSLGDSLAMARLDAGATDDLVVGAATAKAGRARQAGAVAVVFGGPGGLSSRGRLVLHQAVAGVPGSAEGGDEFGESVATAYLQNGSRASLVVGSPGEQVGTAREAGRIYQFPTSAAGPKPTGARSFTLDSAGVKGSVTRKGVFGRALSESR